jgi:DNA-binding NarL/FixJ family response regulator
MPQSFVWLLSVLTVGAFILYARERKQFSEKLSELSRRQTGTERALTEFIDESAKIAREFSKRVPAVSSPVLSNREEVEPPAATTRKRRGSEKRHQVLNLAGKGRPVKEIAERLMLPSGEVELILNLDQTRKTRAEA